MALEDKLIVSAAALFAVGYFLSRQQTVQLGAFKWTLGSDTTSGTPSTTTCSTTATGSSGSSMTPMNFSTGTPLDLIITGIGSFFGQRW